ncbi:LOW QUALITY PROTEIN: alcohol dehydrogenase-like 1 [Camellia sinensis]|uniref:LOW QUALITY PROTEIN: alcohol dehydrogenase-like 1 n=1 Tax=Camellia sinensis TaxID=4442 RepID=UPI001036AE2F|nr:LOW QUALITY PROTEIN: alcohol dehydrogenase-like 1 [Camellia sinensis]
MESKQQSETAGKPIRCKAAVCRKAGEALVIEEIEVDPPKAFEVRIKILCTSLCHTDVTFWKLNVGPVAVFPRIFGHEAVGVVESVGENVEEVQEGDRVLPVFNADCGECRDCKSSKSNSCSSFPITHLNGVPRDGTSRFRDSNGDVLHHFLFVSSFTEYTVVDIANIVKINSLIPVDKACLLSCGVSTGVGATFKVAAVEEGSTVAIFGLGAVGLAVAEGARLRGASKIIGVDLNPEKFEVGKKFGITNFINPTNCSEKSVSEVIKEMTDGGADYCFECIGLVSLMQEAIFSSRPGWGRTVILGVEMHGTPLSISTLEIMRGRTVGGSVFGGMKAKSDIPFLVKKYLDQELNLDGFISHESEVSFQEINKAFDLLLQGKSVRCIIWMDK